MLPRIDFSLERSEEFMNGVESDILEFAKRGLRVLVFAGRRISNFDYENFKRELDLI